MLTRAMDAAKYCRYCGRPQNHPEAKMPPKVQGRKSARKQLVLEPNEPMAFVRELKATPIHFLDGQMIPCGYCFSNWATEWDHLLPRAYRTRGANKSTNLYPSCHRCNLLASDHVFDSLEAKRDFVQRRLKERHEWDYGEGIGNGQNRKIKAVRLWERPKGRKIQIEARKQSGAPRRSILKSIAQGETVPLRPDMPGGVAIGEIEQRDSA